MEHRRQFQPFNGAVDFISDAHNRILENGDCCEDDSENGYHCNNFTGAMGETRKEDSYFGFSKPSRSTEVHEFCADSDDEESGDFLDRNKGKRKLSGIELQTRQDFVAAIPTEELAFYAADNCCRRVGGNQEFTKPYVPLFDKNRLRSKKNLHNHGELSRDEEHEPKRTLEELRFRNKNLKGGMKKSIYQNQETSKPELRQPCGPRRYVDPQEKQMDLRCDAYAGKKKNNCRDCRYF